MKPSSPLPCRCHSARAAASAESRSPMTNTYRVPPHGPFGIRVPICQAAMPSSSAPGEAIGICFPSRSTACNGCPSHPLPPMRGGCSSTTSPSAACIWVHHIRCPMAKLDGNWNSYFDSVKIPLGESNRRDALCVGRTAHDPVAHPVKIVDNDQPRACNRFVGLGVEDTKSLVDPGSRCLLNMCVVE